MTHPSDIAGLSERLEAMTAFAKELSDALLSLRPLGGSECFVKRCGTYYADPTYFKGFIQCESDNRHEAMKDLARARKRATRAEQQRDEAYERAALQGWRTIDSAPKDGTCILLCAIDDTFHEVCTG